MKKRSKKKIKKINKKIIVIIPIILFASILLSLILFNTIYKEKIEIKKLEKEVKTIYKSIENNNLDYNKTKKELKSNITTGKRVELEKSVENYLLDLSKSINAIEKISKDKEIINLLTEEYIKKIKEDYSKTTKHLKKAKEELKTSKDSLDNIKKNKSKYLTNKKISKELKTNYTKLTSKTPNLKEYKLLSDKLNKSIDLLLESYEYLNKNQEYYKIDKDKLVFLKRKKLTEYQSLIDKLKDFKLNVTKPTLAEDKTPPDIKASDINISEGTSFNLKDKITCTDDVDDEVECKIEGNYDVNKLGSYDVNITATDKSNNTSNKKIKVIVNKKVINKGYPYYIEVIRNQNTVIVYGLDDSGNYSKVLRVMPCSVGRSGQETPTGTFTTSRGYEWGALYGGVYGQYSTRIVSDILFHSVPYYSTSKDKLEWEEYNKLGSPASLGCVRMTVRDVKWIFDNCKSGTTVKIYDGNLPTGVTKPSAPKIPANSPNKGWDPTDPDPNNPWNK